MKNDIFREDRITDMKGQNKKFFTIEIGRSDTAFGDSAPFHYHEWYELYYVMEGNISFTLDNIKYEVASGTLIFIAPDCVHNVIYNNDNIKRSLMYFTKDYISPLLAGKMKLIYANPIYVLEAAENEYMFAIIQKLVSEYKHPDEFSYELCKNLIYEMLLYFVRGNHQGEDNEKNDLILDGAKRYIELHYSEQIALEDLSEYTGVSTSHLSRKFRHVLNLTVSDYIRNVRIEHAKILLAETDYSIMKISEMCGYNEYTYFSYVFNKTVKTSPLKYRKLYSSK